MLPVAIDVVTAPTGRRTEVQIDEARRSRHPGNAGIEIELYGARIHLRGEVDAQALRSVLDVLSRR